MSGGQKVSEWFPMNCRMVMMNCQQKNPKYRRMIDELAFGQMGLFRLISLFLQHFYLENQHAVRWHLADRDGAVS